jgi:hypothetical protein
MGKGCRRAVAVWHRRSGKDTTAFLGWMIPEAFRITGTYYYFFPTYAQGKKIIWDGIDSSGQYILNQIPHADLVKRNETELQLTLPRVQGGSQGSIIQIVGTDKLDSIVGTNPVGCIFSEYSLQNPQAWSFVRPILEANGGWAIFIYTPRGQNHGYKLYTEARKSPDWFVSLKTVADTRKHDGTPIISAEQIERMRREGEDEDIIQQEYYCSFAGAQTGSYYSSWVNQARTETRIRPNLFDATLPVDTFWDIGNGDDTVIGFRQIAYNERRWIDCYAANRQGLDHYASVLTELARVRKYRYRHHYFPHDMKVVEFTTNESRLAAARRLGISPASVVPRRPFGEGIDAVRRSFARYWFDEHRCGTLIDALALYHKKWNKDGHCFTDLPDHDWSSHYADMVRYEALTGGRMTEDEFDERMPKAAISTFDPVEYEPWAVSTPDYDS